MQILIPDREEIHIAFQTGEDAVMQMIEQLSLQIGRLTEYICKQNRLIEELQNQKVKNSSNSHKPPSSDGLKKRLRPANHEKREPKSNGGQKGHEGHRLEPVSDPDHEILHPVHTCLCCDAPLEEVEVIGHEKRQVFEIPAIRIEVFEHQGQIKQCPRCGFINKAVFPPDVTQQTQYGSNVKSHAAYFNQQHHIPLDRTTDIFEDVFNHRISEGTVISASEELSEAVEPVGRAVKNKLIGSEVVNFDESGLRVGKKIKWVHTVCTPVLTHYEVHAKRGQDAMDAVGILPAFEGCAVHDCWQPYFNYPCSHGICNAHLLRDIAFIIDRYPQPWATEMSNLLIEIYQEVKKSSSHRLDPVKRDGFGKRYDEIVGRGLDGNPASGQQPGRRGKAKQSPSRNLLVRLNDRKSDILRFMHDFRVPFDNNQAERDIRMVKVRQKVSGTFRTDKGAEIFCRIRGYISTAKKNGCNIMDAIRGAFQCSPFYPPVFNGPE